ncbi:hypothetical protein OG203_07210 [Nocardia sp. NBC_01499]|uniref:hypothetical protein n=1 Tax=Nocardia sp. NBC_01499 TaxID=2903597 RepID=UPI00386C4ECC
MSTEYERTVHSDKSTEDFPSSEQEARSSAWQGDRDKAESAWAASESADQAADAEHASATAGEHESEHAGTTDLDVEPEHVTTTEYDAQPEHATATEYDAQPEHATATEHDAQPEHGAATEHDAEHATTAEHDVAPEQATAVTTDAEADRTTAATSSAEADQVTPAAPDQATTSGNGAGQQQTSLDDVGAALFADADLDRLRTQWREVQGNFVDNPRDAVTKADQIVADVIYQLTTAYAERKRVLEERSAGLQEADTEELRQALRGYRGFFRRLLSIES